MARKYFRREPVPVTTAYLISTSELLTFIAVISAMVGCAMKYKVSFLKSFVRLKLRALKAWQKIDAVYISMHTFLM